MIRPWWRRWYIYIGLETESFTLATPWFGIEMASGAFHIRDRRKWSGVTVAWGMVKNPARGEMCYRHEWTWEFWPRPRYGCPYGY